MKLKTISIIFLLFIASNSFAKEFSLMVSYIDKKIDKQENFLIPNRNVRHFSPVFGFSTVMKNLNFIILGNYINYKFDNISPNFVYNTTPTYLQNTNYKYFYLNPRIGKTRNIKNLSIQYGLSVPIYYKYQHYYTYTLHQTTLIKYRFDYYKYPNEVSLGVLSYGSVEIPIYKKLVLGIFLDYGLNFYTEIKSLYRRRIVITEDNLKYETELYAFNNKKVMLQDMLTSSVFLKYSLKK